MTVLLVDFGSQTIRSVSDEYPNNIYITENTTKKFGVDIISRASKAFSPSGSSILQAVSLQCIKDHLDHFNLKKAIVAGNTVCEHLFHKYPVNKLTKHPFIAYKQECVLDNNILFLPSIRAFIGSDAYGICDIVEENELAIDMGTNCEMVLKHNNRLYICSVPAGPALEGGNIKNGIAAINGAIIDWNEETNEIKTIGDKAPIGICGSVFLKLIIYLLKTGRLKKDGYLSEKFNITSNIAVYQEDIRAVQLAFSAIKAGIKLLKIYSKCDKFNKIYISGNFGGNALKYLKELKIFPDNIEIKQEETVIRFLYKYKNFSIDEWKEYCNKINKKCTYIPVSLMKEYKDIYLKELENGFCT